MYSRRNFGVYFIKSKLKYIVQVDNVESPVKDGGVPVSQPLEIQVNTVNQFNLLAI